MTAPHPGTDLNPDAIGEIEIDIELPKIWADILKRASALEAALGRLDARHDELEAKIDPLFELAASLERRREAARKASQDYRRRKTGAA